MRILGIITTFFVGLVVLLGFLLGVRSLADIRRYFRIRSM